MLLVYDLDNFLCIAHKILLGNVRKIVQFQTRYKWLKGTQNLTEEMMVLLKDHLLLPFQFALRRVLKAFPGKDGKATGAEIETKTGTYYLLIVISF